MTNGASVVVVVSGASVVVVVVVSSGSSAQEYALLSLTPSRADMFLSLAETRPDFPTIISNKQSSLQLNDPRLVLPVLVVMVGSQADQGRSEGSWKKLLIHFILNCAGN